MDQKWFISNIFGTLCFLIFSNFLFVNSHALSNSGSTRNEIDSSAWGSKEDPLDFSQSPTKDIWKNLRETNDTLIPGRPEENAGEKRKRLNVLTFDKFYNLTEKDQGPQNESKIIVINTEDHLRLFKNDDEEEEDTLSPKSFINQIISEDRSKSLERTKRQAENGKRKCRCRRKRRRGMTGRRRRRRRRRRNRTGQQQRPARRRRRRRGRRRNGRRRGNRQCVCKKNGDDEGKSEGGEEPDVEDGDGEEEETTEEGDETTTEEGEGEEKEEEGGDEEGDGEESEDKKEEEENEEGEGSDEESDEEEDEEDARESPSPPEGKLPPPPPPANGMPTYVFPYPNMMDKPIVVMPGGGVPVGSFPTSAVPTFRIPPYPSWSPSLLPGKNIPTNTEN